MFPDGKAFPQTNDWRQRSYVYVWHALGGDIIWVFVCYIQLRLFLHFISSLHNIAFM